MYTQILRYSEKAGQRVKFIALYYITMYMYIYDDTTSEIIALNT